MKNLAPYIFGMAISNNRVVKVEQERVTLRHCDNQGKRGYIWKLSGRILGSADL